MPMYQWGHPETESTIDVLRSMDEIEIKPTKEELIKAGLSENLTEDEWVRLVGPVKWVRGTGWKHRKGHV